MTFIQAVHFNKRSRVLCPLFQALPNGRRIFSSLHVVQVLKAAVAAEQAPTVHSNVVAQFFVGG